MLNSNELLTPNYSKLITNLFVVIDSSDWQALPDIFHPGIIYERPAYQPFVGIERLLVFYRQERIIHSGKHHIENIITEKNCAACWGRFIGLGKDGSKIDVLFADTYSFQIGKIYTRRTHFFTAAV
ncbi:nuclear transport factor 2 family protein [Microcoleus sp. F10-C6]|uniref:nuclear transport factor 2 family protein n=1 Tax=unclassified Microcoleus TaxID=2642155 RepID=UPI002FD1CAA2